MLLKSFFFNFYLLFQNYSLYLILLVLLFSSLLLTLEVRKKFVIFLFEVVLLSVWGFLLDLDGLFLIFLTAEFTIFLLFLMAYVQLYSNYTPQLSKIPVWLLSFLFLFFISYNPLNIFYHYTSYYKSINYIVSGDFFILYHLLFDKLPLITIIIILIISFFSLFFILMYFNLKLVKLFNSKQLKQVYYLRKQVLAKQTTLNSKVYTFQN